MRDYSMAGESPFIDHIFDVIGTTNKYCVEFGASDGYRFSNTRYFKEKDWECLMIDKEANGDVVGEYITAENINDIFKKYKVPQEFDFLSIDIDGNDYWVWKALEYSPRIVCIEYNSHYDGSIHKVMDYDPNYERDRDATEYGASAMAMIKLGESKGYTAVYESDYCNLIFLRNDCMREGLPERHGYIEKVEDSLKRLPNPLLV